MKNRISEQHSKEQPRRSFLKAGLVGGATALGISALSGEQSILGMQPVRNIQENVRPRTRNWKEWGRKNFRGIENETIPSFTEDFRSLSEKGIRLDVNQAIRHGFVSTLCSSEVGLNLREAMEFVSIAAHEGSGRIHVSTSVVFDSFDFAFRMIDHAARVGCTHVLLGYPPSFNPHSEKEIYDITRQMCNVADIGVILYPKFDFSKINPSAIVDILQDLVNIPNVFAAKIFDGPFLNECYARFGQKILLSSPNPVTLLQNVKAIGQQWIGAGPYEVFQSIERPYFAQMLNLMLEGNEGAAMGIFQMLGPVFESFMSRHIIAIKVGTYHWPEHKYYQFCSGANGGYIRQPTMKLSKETMDIIKADYRSIGIAANVNDDMFYLGRANWKG
jgi:4-hydroxy-tetrahydrodipicolinate synthase